MDITFFWFRRDLRLEDNAGLYHALKKNENVQAIFIFDSEILDKLEDKHDGRVEFIHQSLQKINESLKSMGSSMLVKHGNPIEIWKTLSEEFSIKNVYTNHDYEPYAQERDNKIKVLLNQKGIAFQTFKDQCIFEKNEVLKDDGKPYTVFTPYSKKWKSKLNDFYLKSYPTEKYFSSFRKTDNNSILELSAIGFKPSGLSFPNIQINDQILKNYKEKRDYPSEKGTSRLSVHLRFGTVSIRKCAQSAIALQSESWLNELIWRDFYMMILWHFPHVVHKSFKPEYDKIEWRNNSIEFEKWCLGKTGYPLVDAGMRELNATGFMHNRVRMVVASFLVKHLLIDWRWGEAYFAKKLLDFDLSANNGGWQWAAGSGCDAAPYFRVFNPTLQTEKFDPKGVYIRKWVKEIGTFEYPKPIVVHEQARIRALETYKKGLGGGKDEL
ncbi:MAG: deoxyribodipyrimidine photo-lyase [Cytophagales bacterium]